MCEKIYITHDQIEDISCTRCEQETSINWMRDDTSAVICTSDYTVVTRIARAMARDPKNYRCYYYECNRDKETGRLGNYFFEIPKKLVSFRADREKSAKKEMTEEQRKAISERFRKAKEDKKNDSII